MNIKLLLLLWGLAWSIKVSYVDWKKHVIKNKDITCILLLPTIVTLLQQSYLDTPSLISLLKTVGISILLWIIGVWPAGDAKFLISLSLISEMVGINSHNILYSTLLFGFIFSTLLLILDRPRRKSVKRALKYVLSPYNVSMVFIVYLGFNWFVGILFKTMSKNIIFQIVLIFLGVQVLLKHSPVNLEVIYVILAILRAIIDYEVVYSVSFLLNTLKTILVYQFFVSLPILLGREINVVKVRIGDLKEGMIPAQWIVCRRKGKKKEYSLKKAKIFGGMDLIHCIHDPTGFTPEDIKKIKELKRSGKLKVEYLEIYKPIPLAWIMTLSFFFSSLKVFIV